MGAAVCSPRAPRCFLVVSALAASAPRETSAYSPWTPGTRRTAAGSCETVPRAKKQKGRAGKIRKCLWWRSKVAVAVAVEVAAAAAVLVVSAVAVAAAVM